MSILAEIATVLKTTEKNAMARVQGMKLAPVCGRCLGSGQYSFNGTHSRCYGCGGFGCTKPTAAQLPKVLEDARAAVAAGKLDEYLTYLAGRALIKSATKQAIDAWQATRVCKVMKGFNHMVRDEEFAGLAELRAANLKMCRAYEAVQKAADKCWNVKSPDYRANCAALTGALASALEAIKAADAEYVPAEEFEKLAAERAAAEEARHKARFGM